MKNTTQNLTDIIIEIASLMGCSAENVQRLVDITNEMVNGARFASLRGYRSDKSDQTESADHSIILGFSYENMKNADKEVLANLDIANLNVEGFNFDKVDTKGKSLADFKAEVKANLAIALNEMQNPKVKDSTESNDIWLNKVLVFNRNTKRLSIIGKSNTKKVTEVGEYKKTASAPKTIAKEVIRYELKSNDYRRFCIDNLNVVKLEGETLEIGGM